MNVNEMRIRPTGPGSVVLRYRGDSITQGGQREIASGSSMSSTIGTACHYVTIEQRDFHELSEAAQRKETYAEPGTGGSECALKNCDDGGAGHCYRRRCFAGRGGCLCDSPS